LQSLERNFYNQIKAGKIDMRPLEEESKVSVPKNGTWSRAEIFDIHSRFRNPIGRAAIRLLAEAAGEPVTYGQLAQAAGIETDALRPQLGWFSKYSKQVKGLRDTKAWPLFVTDNPKLPKGARYAYRMPTQIAAWWLEAEQQDPTF